MKEHKQLLTDILVVCIAPIALIVLYHFFLSPNSEEGGFLSSDSIATDVAAPGGAGGLGAKSKEILTQLDSIRFDSSFFSDPAYLSLRDFTPAYFSTTTGREYPFSTPDEIRTIREREAAASNPLGAPKPAATTKTTSKTR